MEQVRERKLGAAQIHSRPGIVPEARQLLEKEASPTRKPCYHRDKSTHEHLGIGLKLGARKLPRRAVSGPSPGFHWQNMDVII